MAQKWIYCIEGEVEIGFEKTPIEDNVSDHERYIAAGSRYEAKRIFENRFSKRFTNRFYLENARIFTVNPVKQVMAPAPKLDQTLQLALEF